MEKIIVVVLIGLFLIFMAHQIVYLQKCYNNSTDRRYGNVSRLSSTRALPTTHVYKELNYSCFHWRYTATTVILNKETNKQRYFKRATYHQTRKEHWYYNISREVCLLIFLIAHVVRGFYRSFKNESTKLASVGTFPDNVNKCDDEFYSDFLDYFERTPKYVKHVLTDQLSVGGHDVHVRLHVYPTSLGAYVKDVSKSGVQSKDLMKYEWARYESFKHYPESAAMTPMRLSQAGFYYTGNDDEVRCFHCGLTTSQLDNQETALEAHRRLSPECGFINGTGSENVSIHDDPSGQHIPGASSHVQTGACGQHADLKTTNVENEEVKKSTQIKGKSEISNKASNTPVTMRSHANGSNSKSENKPETVSATITRAGNNSHVDNFGSDSTCTRGRTSRIKDTVVATHRGAILDISSVKQHQYISLASRISSFAKWPSSANQDSSRLAEAGFYYAGFGDCVRCFYCGCGLRNWEITDDPWVEHSRWYPNCGYVIHCNGNQAGASTDVLGNNAVREQAADDHSHARGGEGDADKTSESIDVVLEMGYSRERVEQTVQMLSSGTGTRNITAQAILEALLDEGRENPAEGTCTEGNAARDTDSRRQSNLAVTSDRTLSCNENVANDPQSIAEECQRLRDQMLCKVCLDRDVCVVFQPCGHMVTCSACSGALRKCPICRKLITRRIRAFQS